MLAGKDGETGITLMTSSLSDILLPRAAWSTPKGRSRAAAFVPITLALVGVAAILFGGVSARIDTGGHAHAAAVTDVDPVITGSIRAPEDRRRALQMLDR